MKKLVAALLTSSVILGFVFPGEVGKVEFLKKIFGNFGRDYLEEEELQVIIEPMEGESTPRSTSSLATSRTVPPASTRYFTPKSNKKLSV